MTPPRRWSFTLRMMFVVVACACGYLAWQANVANQRKAMLYDLRRRGAEIGNWADLSRRSRAKPSVPMVRQWMGDEEILSIVVPEMLSDPEMAAIKQMFPESGVACFDGESEAQAIGASQAADCWPGGDWPAPGVDLPD